MKPGRPWLKQDRVDVYAPAVPGVHVVRMCAGAADRGLRCWPSRSDRGRDKNRAYGKHYRRELPQDFSFLDISGERDVLTTRRRLQAGARVKCEASGRALGGREAASVGRLVPRGCLLRLLRDLRSSRTLAREAEGAAANPARQGAGGHHGRAGAPSARPALLDEGDEIVGEPTASRTLPPPSDEEPDMEQVARIAEKYGCELLEHPG